MPPGFLNDPAPAVPLPQTGDELTMHAIVAHNAAPALDPATTVAVAKSANSSDEAAMNAQATAHYGNMTKLANNLNQHDSDIRQRVWPAMTNDEKTTAMALGAKHPLATDTGGLFGTLGQLAHGFVHGADLLRGAGHDVLTGIGAVIPSQVRHGASDVGNAVESPERAMTHFMRTEEYIQNQSATAQGDLNSDQQSFLSGDSASKGFSMTALKYAFSPSEFAQAWRATTRGSTTYFPSALRRLRSQTDPTTLHLAEQVASGVATADLTQGLPQAQANARVATMQTPQFQSLVQQLQDSHITAGQSVVGEKFLIDHPKEGHALSGAIDAAYDFASDPTMKTGLVTRGFRTYQSGIDAGQLAGYLASNSTEYDDAVKNGLQRVIQGARPQRMINAALPHIEAGDYDALRQYFPTSLGRVAGQLAQDGVTTKEGLEDWLSSKVGAKAILEGQAAKLVRGVTLFPGLGPVQDIASGVKVGLSRSLEDLAAPLYEGNDITLPTGETIPVAGSAADRNALSQVVHGALSNVPGVPKVARMLRRLTTLVPTRGFLDLGDPADSLNLKRALQIGLPNHAVSQIMNIYDASDSIGQRFLIAKGAIMQMLEFTGIGTTDRGRELMGAVDQTLDESYRKTAYSVGGIDKMEDATDGGFRAGILENQLSTRINLPNMAEIHRAQVAQSVLTRIGVFPQDLGYESKIWAPLNRAGVAFMNYWRPAVLARVGFPVRVVLDENTEYALRNGLMSQVLPRIALWARRIDDRAEARAAVAAADAGQDEAQTGLARAIAVHAHDVPTEILQHVKSTRDLASAVLGNAAWKAFHAVDPMGMDSYYEAGGISHDLWDSTNPVISAMHGAQSGGIDQSDELLDTVRDGQGKLITHRFGKSGLYSEATKGENTFKYRYHQALGTLGESKLGRAAIASLRDGDHLLTQMRKVTDALDALPEDERALSARAFQLPDGRVPGVDPGVNDKMLMRNWARRVIAHTSAMLTGTNRQFNGDLADELLANHGAPAWQTIRDMEDDRLPRVAYGPDLVEIPRGRILTSRVMNVFAGMMDHLGRQPSMTHAIARALKDVKPAVEARMPDADQEVKDQLIRNLVWNHAANELKPFIHSPEYKTQFEVLHRTAAPFLFAQRQFLMRWGRTFAESPEAIAKLALLNHGAEMSGFVHLDSQGQETFTYPLSGVGTHVVTKTLHALGIQAALPIDTDFTGQVRYLIPGISNPVIPSFGPGMAIPLKAVTNLFPQLHLQGTESALLQEGASQGYVAQILPSTVTRLATGIAALGGQVPTGSETASMVIQGMQQMAATGHGLPENATSQQTAQYLHRLSQWAGINMIQKAILGFLVPASPQENFDTRNYAPRLQQLMNELPYNQAIAEFLKENPDANAYTVFASQSDGGASLPATAAAGKWLDQNMGFADNHPQAAGWFIPRETGHQVFDPAVYREQFNIGAAADTLRQEKSPQQFLEDIQMAPAASVYYKSLDAKDAAIKSAGKDTPLENEIQVAYQNWLGPFLAQNRIFADYLTGANKAVQRRDTIDDLYASLNDPDLPQGPQTEDVRAMVESFAQFNQDWDTLPSHGYAAYDERTNFAAAFIAAGNAFVAQHTDVQDLWNVLIRPTADTIANGYEEVILPQAPIGAGQ